MVRELCCFSTMIHILGPTGRSSAFLRGGWQRIRSDAIGIIRIETRIVPGRPLRIVIHPVHLPLWRHPTLVIAWQWGSVEAVTAKIVRFDVPEPTRTLRFGICRRISRTGAGIPGFDFKHYGPCYSSIRAVLVGQSVASRT